MWFQRLKQECPNAWKEFSSLAGTVLASEPATSALSLEDLPFDLAFGLFLKFFKENDLDFDYNNLAPSHYQNEIEDIFTNFEGVISHYS